LKITPVDISKQEFKKAMRGYDPVEVDTYLEMLGNEFEKLIHANQNYEKRLIELESELKSFKEHESTLKQTLVNVQESTTKSRENSKKEADLIKREAELGAAEMIEKARREVQKLREEKVMLDTQKKSLISRLRHVLTSQMELLDVLEIDEKDISKLRDRTKKVFSALQKSNVEIEITKGESPKEPVPEKVQAASTSEPKPEPKVQADDENADNEPGKINSDIFKDVFGNDLDIEKYTK
jgi:cell division initiation protein